MKVQLYNYLRIFPFASVLPIRPDLYLNDEELAVVIPALLLLPVFFL